MTNTNISNLECAIQIRGDKGVKGHNVLSDLKITMCRTGVEIWPGNNTVRNVFCYDCFTGIILRHSKQNVLENISCRIGNNIPENFGMYGIYVEYGTKNILTNIICDNYSEEKEYYGVYVENEKNLVIKDSNCGPVFLDGEHLRLEGVDGGEAIIAKYGSDMAFVKCRAKILKHFLKEDQFSLEGCKFDEVKVESEPISDDDEGAVGGRPM